MQAVLSCTDHKFVKCTDICACILASLRSPVMLWHMTCMHVCGVACSLFVQVCLCMFLFSWCTSGVERYLACIVLEMHTCSSVVLAAAWTGYQYIIVRADWHCGKCALCFRCVKQKMAFCCTPMSLASAAIPWDTQATRNAAFTLRHSPIWLRQHHDDDDPLHSGATPYLQAQQGGRALYTRCTTLRTNVCC